MSSVGSPALPLLPCGPLHPKDRKPEAYIPRDLPAKFSIRVAEDLGYKSLGYHISDAVLSSRPTPCYMIFICQITDDNIDHLSKINVAR